MNKIKFDKLFEQGVMTNEDRNVAYDNMTVEENGILTGMVDDAVYYKYTISYDIFKNSLTDLIIQKCNPPYCLMNTKPFNKYGLYCGGVYSEWEWFTKETITEYARKEGHCEIEKATDEELWKMLALSSMYWESSYREWYDEQKNKI